MTSILDLKAIDFYKKYKWLIISFVFLSSFGLYLNTLNHSFVLDDTIVIEKNKHVQKGIQGIPDILATSYTNGYDDTNRNTYRPVSLISFAIEKQFFGKSPTIFHLFNIISYALLCVFITYFLFLILPRNKPILPLLIIAIFITHPIHTEVVANIKSRDEIYSMLFGVLSLIYLLKYDFSKKSLLLYLSLAFFVLSIFSKENTITLLVIFPLTLYFFREYSLKKTLSTCSVYLLPVLLLFVLRVIILDNFGQTTSGDANWEIPFNNTLFAADNYIEELATNSAIFLKYLELAVFPVNLSSDYSIGTFEIVSFSDFKASFGLFALLALSAISIFKFNSRSIISYSLLFFLITFSITSNFIFKIGSTLGERFLFLPSLGMAMLIGILIYKLLSLKYFQKTLLPIIVISLLAFYSWKTMDRNKDWENAFVLYSQDIKTNPDNGRIMYGLATQYHKIMIQANDSSKKKTNAEKSISYYKESLKYHPNTDYINYSIANVYYESKDYPSAVEYFKNSLPALNIEEHDIHYRLGLCYENLNNNPEAITSFEKAIDLMPTSEDYWRHLGYVYFPNKNYRKAINAFKKSIELKGESNAADLLNIAVSYQLIKDYKNAKKYYEEVLKIDPENSKALKNLSALQ